MFCFSQDMQDRINDLDPIRYTNFMTYEAFSFRNWAMAVTDLGDGGLMIALTAVIALYLLVSGYRNGALAMVGALLISAGTIALLKLIFIGCETRFGLHDIRSPSGHAALSAAVYGTILMLLTQRLPAGWRIVPWFGLVPLVLVIAATRIHLHFHTPAEVALGLTIGLCSVLCVWALLLRGGQLPPFRARWAALALVLTLVTLHGVHIGAEVWVQRLATMLRVHTPCATEISAEA